MRFDATHHLKVPKDTRENAEYRRALLRRCARDGGARDAVLGKCADDIIFWIDSFAYYHNPLAVPGKKVGPLVCWPFQAKVIRETAERWVQQQKDCLWEKSREMTGTWNALCIADWACLFHSWQHFLCVSHSEMAVDRKGDSHSLFWKIQFLHDHLPQWMLRGARKRKLAFGFPFTHSAITGAASTSRSGVGGRGPVLLDELGQQQSAHEIVGHTADTGPRLFISTHYGIDTEFNRLCERPDMWKRVLHWTLHPQKNPGLYRWNPVEEKVEFLNSSLEVIPESDYAFPPDYVFVTDGSPTGGPFPGIRSPWYDQECLRPGRDQRQVAIHLDIDARGSDFQFFNPLAIRQIRLARCCHPKWQGRIDLAADGVSGRLSECEGGPLRLWRLPDAHGHFPASAYGAGADISTGSGNTPSVLSIGDAKTAEKILEYANARVGGREFASVCVAMLRLYGGPTTEGPLFAWEKQGPGNYFAQKLIELGYRRFYKQTDENPFTLEVKVSEKPGWSPTPESKKLLLENYRDALEKGLLRNPSFEAVDECLMFRWEDASVVAHSKAAQKDNPAEARENHADRVIADALMWRMMVQLGVEKERDVQAVAELTRPGSWGWRREMALAQMRQAEEDAA